MIPLKNMWRERRELLLSGVLGVLLALFLMSPRLIQLLPSQQVKVYAFSSQFDGQPVEVGDQPRICEAITDGGRLVIRVTGRLNELRNYQNLFQTADQNSGIRIEIDEFGAAAVLIADRSELTFLAVPATGAVTPGRFQILIQIVDGRHVTFRLGNSVATGSSESLQPLCSQVIIGHGFDSSRISSGRFRADFSAYGEQRRFVSTGVERVLENEFLRSLALGVMVFCVILAALNITDPAARRFATHELVSNEENSRESRDGPTT